MNRRASRRKGANMARKGAISRAASGDTSFGATALPSDYKRLTVDIQSQVRSDLDVWAAQARANSRANVSIAPAVRVLLARLLEDDELQAYVIDKIRQGEGDR